MENIRCAFSGANTGKGFVSFYDRIFPEDKLDGLYIIKGGSGTGKSTFMRRLGETAQNLGHTCTYYLCGSDASSLDGILIRGNGKSVGVLDGTLPHPKELRCPGTAGDILNFGAFWDSDKLHMRRKEINQIAKEKSSSFETAYRYLGAAKKIHEHIDDLANKIYLQEKGYGAAARIAADVGTAGECEYIQLTGYTMNGIVDLQPDNGNIIRYYIKGNQNIGALFLRDMTEICKTRKIQSMVSVSPLDLTTVEGIYFPKSRVWISTSYKNESDTKKIINTGRFTDREVYSSCKQKVRFGKKCEASLIEGAMESLKIAGENHFKLEEIYKKHMDFKELARMSEIWYSEILSRLD